MSASSAITSSGTIAITKVSQSQNLFMASPNGSSGVMSPRAIVSADLPGGIGTVTSSTLTSGVIPVATGAGSLGDGYDTLSGNAQFPTTNAVVWLGTPNNGWKIVAIDGGITSTATNLPAFLVKQRVSNGSGFFTNILVIIDDASYDLNHSKIQSWIAKSRANPVMSIDYIGNLVVDSSLTCVNVVASGNVTVGNGNGYGTTSVGGIFWRSIDGVIQFHNAAFNDFTRIELGGSTIGGGSAIGYPSIVSIKSAANSGNVAVINFANGAATTFAFATNFASISAYDVTAVRDLTALRDITTVLGNVNGGGFVANSAIHGGFTGTALTASLTNDMTITMTNNVIWKTGTGSPEGVVASAVGGLYTRTDGGAGTTIYVKESGSSSTGWIAK